MTAVKRWAAAGSSATILAGGLFLGAPAAHADTCAAPGAGTVVSNLVTAADHLHDTGVHFNSLVTDAGVLTQLQTQQAVLEDAIVNDSTIDRAQGAWTTIRDLQRSYAEGTDSSAIDDAYAASAAAAANFEAAATEARAQNLVFMENGADLMALFEASCGTVGAGGTTPGAGTGTGTNTGLNVDTAQAEESGVAPVAGPLAALLAAGGAAAAALRMRRRERA